MNLATLDYSSLSADLHALPNSIPSDSKNIRYSLASLRFLEQSDLPLLVDVSSTTKQANVVVYNCILTSVTTKTTWTVSYRYSEFDTFRAKIENEWTCHDPKCSGSCQALRDIISAFFPKKRLSIMSSNQGTITSRKKKFELKRLSIMSSNQGTITSRKKKFELVLIHLLRSVLLPGSAMKCRYARQHLQNNVFEFLGVKDAVDRRSVLQIFIDDHQVDAAMKKNKSNSNPKSNTAQCTVCLNNLEVETDGSESDTSYDGDNVKFVPDNDLAKSQILLPCKHSFHRNFIYVALVCFQTR
ncbi:LOW QUALITY PROTEIN: hypothetical protein PHMEG_00024987 [Phytophthora megakarya]|uniref:PX domain-containing protein n=1 Tax=Phytophthora megakarya TaxID=4795 RepID=A0A225VEK5_9STRA|nr:LOW QUALITY PROTEIN: hypothetical protein PHMEG_00024987 [Phytophthora megakarya]